MHILLSFETSRVAERAIRAIIASKKEFTMHILAPQDQQANFFFIFF
jgi:hypothetical protein